MRGSIMKLMTVPAVDMSLPPLQFTIIHTTIYSYMSARQSSVMALCMKPRQNEYQTLEHYELSVNPDTFVDQDTDCFGNTHHFFDLHRPHSNLTVSSIAKVRLIDRSQALAIESPCTWSDVYPLESTIQHWDYLQLTNLTRTKIDLDGWLSEQGGIDYANPFSFLKSLERCLSQVINYRPGSTTIETTVDELLERHEGVCQDISQLMIAISRSRGIPAKYVMGYLYVVPGESQRVVANATHAWVECFLPGFGWYPFDPTNPDVSSNCRVKVACGRDYRDVPPTKGVSIGDGEATMDVNVSVFRDEDSQHPQIQQQSSIIP